MFWTTWATADSKFDHADLMMHLNMLSLSRESSAGQSVSQENSEMQKSCFIDVLMLSLCNLKA